MVKRIEIRVLSEQHVSTVAPSLRQIVDLVEDTYRMVGRGEAEVPTKIGVHPGWDGGFCHAMPAWVAPARALGMKWISYYPGNTKRDLADSTGLIILNDPDTAQPVAVMEGMWITYARTAACAAVAARHLANPQPVRLGLVGCGGLGTWSLRVLSEVFPTLKEVHVSSRTAQSRNAFCAAMQKEGRWKLTPADRAEDAVRGMDIVVSSIPKSGKPPVQESFWTSGSVAIPLDVTAAWDDACYSKADVFVSDGFEAFSRSAGRQRPGMALPAHPVELSDVLLGRKKGRTSAAQRIMAVPTGVASVDMTLGWEIYRRAKEAGLGTVLALT
jgi:ornithine cyclodeaminase/alanine dehydrogenase-like protein (mu-crystallin family)